MAPSDLFKLSRAASRGLRSSTSAQAAARRSVLPTASRQAVLPRPNTSRKLFTTPAAMQRGIMPDTDDPHGKEHPSAPVTKNVAELTDGQYHELADEYLENVVVKLEEVQEQREGWDVEYSSGVLTVTTPDKGIYVINKQPPNKQIWLSSPVSGPKRFDWVVLGEGQGDKEDTGAGSWMYMRDGTTLDEIFAKELQIEVTLAPSTYGN